MIASAMLDRLLHHVDQWERRRIRRTDNWKSGAGGGAVLLYRNGSVLVGNWHFLTFWDWIDIFYKSDKSSLISPTPKIPDELLKKSRELSGREDQWHLCLVKMENLQNIAQKSMTFPALWENLVNDLPAMAQSYFESGKNDENEGKLYGDNKVGK